MVRLEADTQSGLRKTSAADAFQVRSVAQERFVRQIGRLSEIAVREIGKALTVVLSLDS